MQNLKIVPNRCRHDISSWCSLQCRLDVQEPKRQPPCRVVALEAGNHSLRPSVGPVWPGNISRSFIYSTSAFVGHKSVNKHVKSLTSASGPSRKWSTSGPGQTYLLQIRCSKRITHSNGKLAWFPSIVSHPTASCPITTDCLLRVARNAAVYQCALCLHCAKMQQRPWRSSLHPNYEALGTTMRSLAAHASNKSPVRWPTKGGCSRSPEDRETCFATALKGTASLQRCSTFLIIFRSKCPFASTK